MQTFLNMVGDGDELDILHDVEKAFGIKIEDSEAESTITVGALYDLILAKCGTAERTQACFSQIVFYRLRCSLPSGDKAKIRPDTSIDLIWSLPGRSIAQKWRELASKTGLTLPPLEMPIGLPQLRIRSVRIPLAELTLFCGAIGAFAAARYFGVGSAGSFWLAAIGVPLVAVLARQLLYLFFRDIPRRIETLGELAREAAVYGFAELSRIKANPGSADRWAALTAILRQISGHKAPITRDTTFFPR